MEAFVKAIDPKFKLYAKQSYICIIDNFQVIIHQYKGNYMITVYCNVISSKSFAPGDVEDAKLWLDEILALNNRFREQALEANKARKKLAPPELETLAAKLAEINFIENQYSSATFAFVNGTAEIQINVDAPARRFIVLMMEVYGLDFSGELMPAFGFNQIDKFIAEITRALPWLKEIAELKAKLAAPVIKTGNGELYLKDGKVVGYKVVNSDATYRYEGDKLHYDANLTMKIIQHDSGTQEESYYRGGELHRDNDLPAYIARYKNGAIASEDYYRGGKRHRDNDLPALVRLNENGIVTIERYYREGKIHRDNGLPAVIKRDENDKREEYYCWGIPHRNGDLPAVICRNKDGSVKSEKYYCGGVKYTPTIPGAETMEQLRAELERSRAIIEKIRAQVE